MKKILLTISIALLLSFAIKTESENLPTVSIEQTLLQDKLKYNQYLDSVGTLYKPYIDSITLDAFDKAELYFDSLYKNINLPKKGFNKQIIIKKCNQ